MAAWNPGDTITAVKLNEQAIIKSDSYSGNYVANRAIAHGIGRKPPLVVIFGSDGTVFMIGRPGYITRPKAEMAYAVTEPDNTNFYVGNSTNWQYSANNGSTTYYWIAIG